MWVSNSKRGCAVGGCVVGEGRSPAVSCNQLESFTVHAVLRGKEGRKGGKKGRRERRGGRREGRREGEREGRREGGRRVREHVPLSY